MEQMKIFKVKCREGLRYFDDDNSGFFIKSGDVIDVHEKHLRSNELKSALLKQHLLIVEGSTRFVYKNDILTVSVGDKGNYIVGDNEGVVSKSIKPKKTIFKKVSKELDDKKINDKKIDDKTNVILNLDEPLPDEEEEEEKMVCPKCKGTNVHYIKGCLDCKLKMTEILDTIEPNEKVFKSENLVNSKDEIDVMFDNYEKIK